MNDKLSKIKQELLNEDVYASNKEDALTLFNTRKLYDAHRFPSSADDPRAADLWYEKPLYGKINHLQDAVYVSEANLKPLDVEDETILVVDFVADAYKDFSNYYALAAARGALKKSGKLYKPHPTRAWSSVNKLHHEHLENIYKLFVASLLGNPKRARKVVSFRTFLNEFVKTLKNRAPFMPFTRSAFVLSKFCSPMISGLMIELGNHQHGNDQPKVNDYINDENFEFYRTTARRFGFYIDRNAPWRLIVNVSSPRMQEYAARYGIQETPGSAAGLFDAYCHLAHLNDIELLKSYLEQFYNTFVAAYPAKRKPLTPETRKNRFGDNFWIQVYLKIRAYEADTKWDAQTITNKTKEALMLYNTIDLESATNYINEETHINVKPKKNQYRS